MSSEIHMRSVEFFDAQFQRQIREREYALNPFETLALDYLKGAVLDFGSGLGSLNGQKRGSGVTNDICTEWQISGPTRVPLLARRGAIARLFVRPRTEKIVPQA